MRSPAAIATLLAAEFYVGGFALTLWIPFGVLVPLSLFAVWWLGHSRLEIRDGELFIRGAHLPLRYVSGIVALDAATLRRVVGREGDPAAFVSIRPWIGPGVQLWLDDPEDPAPYWVVSSRHPQQVVDLVRSRTPPRDSAGQRRQTRPLADATAHANRDIVGISLRPVSELGQRFQQRVAVITGASRGIGLAVAQRLVDEGARVVVTARKPEPLAAAVEQLGEQRRRRRRQCRRPTTLRAGDRDRGA